MPWAQLHRQGIVAMKALKSLGQRFSACSPPNSWHPQVVMKVSVARWGSFPAYKAFDWPSIGQTLDQLGRFH